MKLTAQEQREQIKLMNRERLLEGLMHGLKLGVDGPTGQSRRQVIERLEELKLKTAEQ